MHTHLITWPVWKPEVPKKEKSPRLHRFSVVEPRRSVISTVMCVTLRVIICVSQVGLATSQQNKSKTPLSSSGTLTARKSRTVGAYFVVNTCGMSQMHCIYKFISVFTEGFGITNANWHSSFCQVNRLCVVSDNHSQLLLCRCIRPNDLRSRNHFQLDKVIIQLRYTGVIETTIIRKQVCKHLYVCVLSVCLCVCLYVCMFVCQSDSLCVCLSVCVFACLCVCLVAHV